MINCNDPKARDTLHDKLDEMLAQFDGADIFMVGVTPSLGGFRFYVHATGGSIFSSTEASAVIAWQGLGVPRKNASTKEAMTLIEAALIKICNAAPPSITKGTCYSGDSPDTC
jgi:hypothetical protein